MFVICGILGGIMVVTTAVCFTSRRLIDHPPTHMKGPWIITIQFNFLYIIKTLCGFKDSESNFITN